MAQNGDFELSCETCEDAIVTVMIILCFPVWIVPVVIVGLVTTVTEECCGEPEAQTGSNPPTSNPEVYNAPPRVRAARSDPWEDAFEVVRNRGAIPPTLHKSASRSLYWCRNLLNQGYIVDATDTYGWTALMHAAEAGRADVINLLLERGAAIDHVDNQGVTALMVAIKKSPIVNVVDTLLTKGASINIIAKNGINALLTAAKYNKPSLHYMVLEKSQDIVGDLEYAKDWASKHSDDGLLAALLDLEDDPRVISKISSSRAPTAPAPPSRTTMQDQNQSWEGSQRAHPASSQPFRDPVLDSEINPAPTAPPLPVPVANASHPSSRSTEEDRNQSSNNEIPYSELVIQPNAIGGGSFATVYVARWKEINVAVKVLLDRNTHEGQSAAAAHILATLHKEAATIGSLRHPNIVQFLGYCVSPPCVVTELCSRGSLDQIITAARMAPDAAAGQSFTWGRRLSLLEDAAKGLYYLHSRNPPLIHRDIKSPNLMVDEYWRVKIGDFGLSKDLILGDSMHASSLVNINPMWAAPEVLHGALASKASDVYSLGIMMWELLTWQKPWHDTPAAHTHTPIVIIGRVIKGDRPKIPSVNELPGRDTRSFKGLLQYIALMRACWTETAGQRPPIEEVIKKLQHIKTLAPTSVEEKQAEDLCVVCLECPPTAGFAHGETMHRCVCEGCARKFQKRNDKQCPMCREQANVLIFKVY